MGEEGSERIESDWVVKEWGFGRDLVDAVRLPHECLIRFKNAVGMSAGIQANIVLQD
jgi:hypothetical protein